MVSEWPTQELNLYAAHDKNRAMNGAYMFNSMSAVRAAGRGRAFQL